MASRKEQKAAARAERLRKEAEQRAAERRARLLKILGVVCGAVVAVVAVLILIVAANKPEKADPAAGENVAAKLAGVQQNGTVAGNPDAPVTIIEYGDLQCPICARFSEDELPAVIDTLVKTGKAKFEFRNWTILGPDSETAAKAALAAAEQGKYLNFVELFYRNQGAEGSGYVTDKFLEARAREAGLDIDRFNRDRNSAKYNQQLLDISDEAMKAGFSGTPAFIVEGPTGDPAVLPKLTNADTLAQAVAKVSDGS